MFKDYTIIIITIIINSICISSIINCLIKQKKGGAPGRLRLPPDAGRTLRAGGPGVFLRHAYTDDNHNMNNTHNVDIMMILVIMMIIIMTITIRGPGRSLWHRSNRRSRVSDSCLGVEVRRRSRFRRLSDMYDIYIYIYMLYTCIYIYIYIYICIYTHVFRCRLVVS